MLLRHLLLPLLLVAAPALAQPDLAVTAFTLEDSSGPPGARVSADVTVCNFGSVEVDDPSVGYFLSEDDEFDRDEDTLLETDDVTSSLDPGECDDEGEQFTIPSSTDPGDYTLFAVADPFDVLAEPDEANNIRGRPFTVTGSTGGGFVVTASASPATIAPGGATTVTATVTNNTTSAATLDGWIVARRGGSAVLTQRVGSGTVPAGATVTVTFPLRAPASAPAGTYDVTFNVGTFPSVVRASDTFAVTVAAQRLAAGVPGAPLAVEPVAGDLFAGASSVGATAADLSLAAWPNPTASRATLSFALAEVGPVRLAVYDVLGREVAVLAEGVQGAGEHEVSLDASALPAGVYLVRLVAGGAVHTQRLTLVR